MLGISNSNINPAIVIDDNTSHTVGEGCVSRQGGEVLNDNTSHTAGEGCVSIQGGEVLNDTLYLIILYGAKMIFINKI